MEAAWANIVQTPLLKTVSGDAFSKQAAEEKHISRREKAFVSMVASSMSKVSIFSTWQLGQLEALVPMTSLTSISTNIVDRIGFEDSNETNIILNKLKSQEIHDTSSPLFSRSSTTSTFATSTTIAAASDGNLLFDLQKTLSQNRLKLAENVFITTDNEEDDWD